MSAGLWEKEDGRALVRVELLCFLPVVVVGALARTNLSQPYVDVCDVCVQARVPRVAECAVKVHDERQ